MTNETRFRPVTGEESKILASQNQPGWVYFASDTGRIYFDYDEDTRLMMGGGSGATIFYAADANVIDTGADNEYRLHYDSLEEVVSDPKEKDIIINTVDNCFYKILSIENNLINTVRIAVAGSGGGSGEGPSTPTGSCSANIPEGQSNKISTLYGEPCILEYDVVAKNAAGVNTEGGYVSFYAGTKNNINQSSIPLAENIVVTNGRGSFDIGPYLQDITQEQPITARFMLDNGSEDYVGLTVTWRVTTYNISQQWEYDFSKVNSDNMFYINYEIIGGGGLEKITHAIIDNNLEITKVKTNVGLDEIAIDRSQYNLGHGIHTIELYTDFQVGTKKFRTNSITKEIIFADADNKVPIIITGDFNRVVDQYDTRVIPIYFYNTTSAQLMADGQLIDTLENIEEFPNQGTLKYWFYTPTESGLHKLSIACGSVKYDIDIIVNELKLTVEETPGYAFKIKASDFTSQDSLRKWSYGLDDNKITLSFSENFDWINGGLKDEDDENGNKRPYICIKAGTRMTINYKLFKKSNTEGKNIKVIFKVTNCGKYDTEIINSYDINSGRGLLMTAQSALFKSASSSVESQYCEENYTEYEIDYTPFAPENSDKLQYVMPWLAGVPAGIAIIPKADTFNQPDDNLTDIVIGSDDCDVNLYLFKVYERHLTDKQHLDNFIMDALNAKEILSRHDRNDVLNDNGNGEIDWRKVAEKNPNCQIHLYKIPRITKNKKDEIGKAYVNDFLEGKESTAEAPKYYALYENGDTSTPVIKAGTDVGCPFSYKVQGTSSEKYVLSAANLDTSFKGGFIDKEGNKITKYSLDENVPGENYFNTKVNVASCEGANNALNAAWYNDYQPYVSAAKARNPKKRDTMLFKPGIVFIWDENPLYEITDASSQDNLDLNIFKGNSVYKNNPFYKQYAICNFGNSKKNKDTLHDKNNPSEITIEVTDNQNIGQHMCAVMGRRETTFINAEGKEQTTVESKDITNEEISYEIQDAFEEKENKETGEKTLEPIKKVVGNDIYNQFYMSMEDNDFDVRYVNGSDGVANASPKQIVGFFKLCQWFALNDPNKKSSAHPHGYTEEAFTENTPGAVYYSEPAILINGKLYYDNEGENEVAAKDLKEDEVYYKQTTIVVGTDELGNDILDTVYIIAENGVDYRLTGYGVTFEPYVFKEKITFKTGDGYTYTYKSKLAGEKVSTYAKIYFYDTHQYRMAKLLSECEDHLIMDSIIYHYLFIERHLMVDNVAKNTFWSSEDENNQYWQLIKDYDNDTADGIDNDGKLSFTYGIEPDDRQANGLSYFNAPNTVWFNFVHGLESIRMKMYRELKEAWTVNKYLNAFEEWQSSIPEICWIEDYYRKYLRPYEIFKDGGYLAKLEGGKKTYQRRQFEIYQNSYMDSKYQSLGGNNTVIYLRANSDSPKDINLPVTMYSDCYVYQSWAQNIIKSRVKRGEVYNIKCPENISRLDDATLYWYFANTYSTIGDLGALKTKQIELGESRRLQTLIATGKDGEKLPPFNSPTNLAIGQANLLKHIKLNGLSSQTGLFPVDLENLASLEDFDGVNSDFTSIAFPQGAPIKTIKLEGPKILSARDLKYLTEFSLKDYNNLEAIYFDNIDSTEEYNSLDFVTKANNLKQYCLLNVHWKLDKAEDEIYFDDETISISFLDKIAKKEAMSINGRDSVPKAKALTGTLTISEEAYNGEHSLEFYEKYAEIFPDLNIIFESENCKLMDVTVLDGNGKIAWNRKFKTSVVLSEEFFSKGTPSSFLDLLNEVITSKASNTQQIFTFANKWDVDGKEVQITPQLDEDETLILSSLLPLNETVSGKDIIIKPIFNAETRKYSISYYSLDGNELYYQEMVDYGAPMSEVSNKFYPYKDDSQLKLNETYELSGWAIQKNGEKLDDESYDKLTVQSDYNFYGVFEVVEDVHTKVLDEKYLEIVTKAARYPSTSVASELWYGNTSLDPMFSTPATGGCTVGFSQAAEGLRGKITLPHHYKGIPIFGFNRKYSNLVLSNVTHIFWEEDSPENPSQLYSIGMNAFYQMPKLQHFEFPSTVRSVGNSAFAGCSQLEMPNLLYSNIIYIGPRAFSNIKGSNELYIPSTLIEFRDGAMATIGEDAFRNWSVPSIKVYFGSEEKPFTLNAGSTFGPSSFGCKNKGITEIFVYTDQLNPTDLKRLNSDDEDIVLLKQKIFKLGIYSSLSDTVDYHLN